MKRAGIVGRWATFKPERADRLERRAKVMERHGGREA